MTQTEGEYPTRKQIEDFFSAWKKDGEAGILAQLQRASEQRQEAEASQDVLDKEAAQPAQTAAPLADDSSTTGTESQAGAGEEGAASPDS